MGSINEGGGFMQKLLSVDFYRKLPDDVAHATKTGAILSWAAAFLMGLLFLTELSSYLSGVVTTSFDIDTNSAQDIEIFLKITTPHVACQFLSIDASNVLGTRRTNISKSIQKCAFPPPTSQTTSSQVTLPAGTASPATPSLFSETQWATTLEILKSRTLMCLLLAWTTVFKWWVYSDVDDNHAVFFALGMFSARLFSSNVCTSRVVPTSTASSQVLISC